MVCRNEPESRFKVQATIGRLSEVLHEGVLWNLRLIVAGRSDLETAFLIHRRCKGREMRAITRH
jgi:hypothetical protein